MFFHEINAMHSDFKPLFTLFHLIVHGQNHPGKPGCLPYPFVRVNDGAIPVETKGETTICKVDGVRDPEGEDILQKPFFVGLQEVLYGLSVQSSQGFLFCKVFHV